MNLQYSTSLQQLVLSFILHVKTTYLCQNAVSFLTGEKTNNKTKQTNKKQERLSNWEEMRINEITTFTLNSIFLLKLEYKFKAGKVSILTPWTLTTAFCLAAKNGLVLSSYLVCPHAEVPFTCWMSKRCLKPFTCRKRNAKRVENTVIVSYCFYNHYGCCSS